MVFNNRTHNSLKVSLVLVTFLIIVGILGIMKVQVQSKPITKTEYLAIRLSSGSEENITANLNIYGQQGWRLICVSTNASGYQIAFFAR